MKNADINTMVGKLQPIKYLMLVYKGGVKIFFFAIEKSVVLKTCQTGKIYEKNWFWRVATFGGLATPQNVF